MGESPTPEEVEPEVSKGRSSRSRLSRKSTTKGLNEKDGEEDMTLGEVWHQKSGEPQGLTERTAARRGEAASKAMSDEAEPARHAQTSRGAEDLLLQALARENILLTSTSRTARCGPACRVVWEGTDRQRSPLSRLRLDRTTLSAPLGHARKTLRL